jgi:hypothetical protein
MNYSDYTINWDPDPPWPEIVTVKLTTTPDKFMAHGAQGQLYLFIFYPHFFMRHPEPLHVLICE